MTTVGRTPSLEPFGRGDYRTAFATGLLAFAVYVYTLAPTVTGEDSGEFIGAAHSLGIPHPPGYPVWTMLAHIFTWIPLGNVAWRVNLLSAICGAGTVTLLVLIGLTLTRSRFASALGALLFAFSRVFWEQALIAEVYTLNTLFLGMLLLTALRGVRPGHPAALYTLALLAGIGTGVHNTQILLLPFWVVFAWRYLPEPFRRSPSFYGMAGVFFGLGCTVHLYLLVASQFDPAVDWGNPDTVGRWWDVLRREQYAFMLTQYPRSLARFAEQLLTMARFMLRDFLSVGLFLGALGAVFLYARDRFLTLFLGAMAAATVVAITLMQNFEQNREWLWVMRVFTLPAEFVAAIGIIAALAWSGARFQRLQYFLTGMVVAALLGSLVLHSQQSKRTYFYAADYGHNILASLPENAIYVPAADHQAFPVFYLQAVEGLRPDVTLLRKYGYLDLDAVPGLREADPAWNPNPKRRFEPAILGWLIKNTDRPLVLSKQVAIAEANVRFAPIGLLVQAVRPNEEPSPERDIDDLTWRNPLPENPMDEYSLSLIQYDVALARARMDFARGNPEPALVHVEAAVEFGHREPEVLNNAGVLCARNGAWDAAARYFREILGMQPGHEAAQRNLERVKRRRER